MPQHLSFLEREQLSNCRFYSLFAAPAGLALIAFSLMLTVAKLGLSGRPIPEGSILLGNWLLAPIVAAASNAGPTGSFGIGTGGLDGKALAAWAVVGIPLLWGVWVTLSSSLAIFG